MRPFLTFFLFVCFHLLGGIGPAYTTNHISPAVQPGSAARQSIHGMALAGERLQSKFTNATEQFAEYNFQSIVEDEDDDEENDSPRRNLLSINYLSAFYQAFIDIHPGSLSQTPGIFAAAPSSNLSCKYIVYRNLRI